MSAIKSLTVTYDALNEYGTFSEGDTVTGKVILALSKETAIESLFVKAKGDADVHWTKRNGDRTYTYSAHNRYFKLKQFLIPENTKDTVLPQGTHVYEFHFNIPPGSMPASFKGSHGKIVYKLEAKLSRSWRMDHTVEKEIHFVSKSFPNLQSLMSHQAGSTNKEMGFFSKGNVHMDVMLDGRAYAPGKTMSIVAKINNSSSSEMTPKFSLIQDVVYRANGNTKHEGNVIHKVVDHCIKPQTQKEVTVAINIPCGLMQTIQNCDIISVEYHLKVYLDISFASDPEVMFPVIILPPDLAPGPHHGLVAGPYPAGAVGGPSYSDFPPPAVSMGPYPVGAVGYPTNSAFPPTAISMSPYPASAHSGSYEYLAPPPVYPYTSSVNTGPPGVNPAHMSGCYSNPVPQLPSPYGGPSPFSSSSSSSSVLHPPPTAQTFHPRPCAPSAPMMNTDFLSQSEEAPPAYSILFPSSATEKSDPK